jgi:hypothetical protein
MATKTVKVATHPDLVPADVWADEIGKDPKSLQRDARLGIGPPRVRIGNRCYYWREQCDEYLRELFQQAAQ